MSQHGHSRLSEYLVPRELCHLLSKVNIGEVRLRGLQVFSLNGQVCHRVSS